jgi:hypothetical protein
MVMTRNIRSKAACWNNEEPGRQAADPQDREFSLDLKGAMNSNRDYNNRD